MKKTTLAALLSAAAMTVAGAAWAVEAQPRRPRTRAGSRRRSGRRTARSDGGHVRSRRRR